MTHENDGGSAAELAPSSKDPSAASGSQLLAMLALAWAPFAFLVARFNFVSDDAYITFRYARNFAEGKGLVYNPGVDPPVEGYSEFLWAVLLRMGFEFGWAPESVSRVLSIGAGVVAVGLVVHLAWKRLGDRPIALAAVALFVGAAPPLGVWATGGMATMPAAALATALFWVLFSGEKPSILFVGLVASLLALMRADAALLVMLILAPAIVVGFLRRERDLWRPAFAGALISAATFGAHVAWRYSVYGDWLPNTARAKLGYTSKAAGRGFDYVVSSFLSMPGLGTAMILGPLAALVAFRRFGAAASVTIASLTFGVLGYSIVAGGDFMAFSRFLVPAIPIAALGLGALVAAIEGRSKVAAAVLAAATVVTMALAAFDVHAVPEEVRMKFHFRHNQRLAGVQLSTSEVEQWDHMKSRAETWAVTGRALGQHAPPGASVVFGAVGAIGYFSNLFVYDRNGLVTREVAMRPPHEELRSPGHDKVVGPRFFMKYSPTYLNVGVCKEADFPPIRAAKRLGNTELPGVVLWAVPGAPKGR